MVDEVKKKASPGGLHKSGFALSALLLGLGYQHGWWYCAGAWFLL